jgi:glycerol-3-phosphate acyltransferase PlsY
MWAWFGLLGYVCGSLPFGVIVPRLWGKGDPRTLGSGNIGATNVYRLGGLKLAILVFFCDALKGFLPLLMVPADLQYSVGIGCILGHMFPWMLRFKGGKGVATTCGVLMVLSPLSVLCSLCVWSIIFRTSGISSLAALGATTANFVFMAMFETSSHFGFSFIVAILIFIQHRENLKRLFLKIEPRTVRTK